MDQANTPYVIKEIAMMPRQPEEPSKEDVQDETRQAIPEALDDAAAANDQHSADMQRHVPLQEVKEENAADTKAEVDRTELYMRGPTAFTA
jgi:hypothetical protein